MTTIESNKLKEVDLLVLIHDAEGRNGAAGESASASFAGALPEAILSEFRRFCRNVKDEKTKTHRSAVFAADGIRLRARMTSLSFYPRFAAGERLKIAAADTWQDACDQGETVVAFAAPAKIPDAAEWAGRIAEGIALGSYRYDEFKSKKDDTIQLRGSASGRDAKRRPTMLFLVDPSDRAKVRAEVDRTLLLADSINTARDLVNAPGRRHVPADLARRAQWVAKSAGLQCEVFDEKRLAKEGYNGLLTVGAGSNYPPRMIILRYRPPKAAKGKHLCLVGKGITFDTGGISMKPKADMWHMKADMAGAASVLYAIEAIARQRLPVRVTAIIAAAENAVGCRATLPGEVFKTRQGKTIHVADTDAEGRLVLTDALHRAGEEKPTHIIDVATLTGALRLALGTSITGLMGNDSAFSRRVIEAGVAAGEDIWELPLYEEYRRWIESDVADLDNIGPERFAGTIIGGLFLSEFAPKETPWVHLDVAYTAFLDASTHCEGRWKYFHPGATGVMIRTFARLVERM